MTAATNLTFSSTRQLERNVLDGGNVRNTLLLEAGEFDFCLRKTFVLEADRFGLRLHEAAQGYCSTM
ncbi:hypothetical protein U1Q18_003974 [Sarracenia purpurea var. burkii]